MSVKINASAWAAQAGKVKNQCAFQVDRKVPVMPVNGTAYVIWVLLQQQWNVLFESSGM